MSESRIYSKLVHGMRNADDIVSNELEQQLVGLRRLGARANKVTELPLDRAERALDVRTLMVDLQEVATVEAEEMPQLVPRLVRRGANAVRLERDHGRNTESCRKRHVAVRGVGLVAKDAFGVEIGFRGFETSSFTGSDLRKSVSCHR